MGIHDWRTVWSDGFCPSFSRSGLVALLSALQADDRRITQGSTTSPPAINEYKDFPLEAGDAIAIVGWTGNSNWTVGDAEEFFAKCCYEAGERLGGPAECRWFLNWFDETPRDTMRRELITEIEKTLSERNSEKC